MLSGLMGPIEARLVFANERGRGAGGRVDVPVYCYLMSLLGRRKVIRSRSIRAVYSTCSRARSTNCWIDYYQNRNRLFLRVR